MKLEPATLELDWSEVEKRARLFIREYVEQTSSDGVVIGLSGGVDSSTSAALAALALGGDKVTGLLLPEHETYNDIDVQHAKQISEKFRIRIETVDITPALDAFYRSVSPFQGKDKVAKGNIKARMRMTYLYYYANKCSLLVCGNSDKSETMMGYFTKWGDVSADFAPLMDLYKTQVRRLARYLGIPEHIVTKPSSPGLWPGQSAEQELGVEYETLDLILCGLEHFMDCEEIASQIQAEIELVRRVRFRWLRSEHKRRMPLTTKMQYRTPGMDFRLARVTTSKEGSFFE